VRVRLSSWIRHITMCARTACAMRSRIRGRVVNHARVSFCKIWDPRGPFLYWGPAVLDDWIGLVCGSGYLVYGSLWAPF
jgi:hypothetical protein